MLVVAPHSSMPALPGCWHEQTPHPAQAYMQMACAALRRRLWVGCAWREHPRFLGCCAAHSWCCAVCSTTPAHCGTTSCWVACACGARSLRVCMWEIFVLHACCMQQLGWRISLPPLIVRVGWQLVGGVWGSGIGGWRPSSLGWVVGPNSSPCWLAGSPALPGQGLSLCVCVGGWVGGCWTTVLVRVAS